MEIEKGRPVEEQDAEIEIVHAGPSLCRVDPLTLRLSRDAYIRLMNTVYGMALHPTMPLHHFGMIIETQRKNRVKFINGKYLQ